MLSRPGYRSVTALPSGNWLLEGRRYARLSIRRLFQPGVEIRGDIPQAGVAVAQFGHVLTNGGDQSAIRVGQIGTIFLRESENSLEDLPDALLSLLEERGFDRGGL